MASLITRFDIEKFDEKNEFVLGQIKMRSLMVQHGCDVALETLPVDMKAGETDALMKKAYSTLILCLGDRVLWEVTKETTPKEFGRKVRSLSQGVKLVNSSASYVIKGSSEDEKLSMKNDEMTELVMDSGGSYHMTHMRDFLYDFKVVDGGSVQLGDNMTCTNKETGKVKIQLHD
ncbi:hypothetical protein Tco_0942374 [Tanacetum coccineum]